jgi:protein subunit release factor A
MSEKQNPLLCGCAVVGLQKIDPLSGRIYYEDMHVKHCEMHANAAAELARLQAIEAAGREAKDVLTQITDGAIAVHEAGEKHGMSARAELDHRDLKAARTAKRKLVAALAPTQPGDDEKG